MTNQVNIVLSSDKNYFKGIESTLASIIHYSSSSINEFNIYILNIDFSDQQIACINSYKEFAESKYCICIHIFWIDFIMPEIINEMPKFKNGSVHAYARLFAPQLINCDNWLIWIDADMFVFDNLAKIFPLLNKDILLYAVPDRMIGTLRGDGHFHRLKEMPFSGNERYVNSGFLIINVQKWNQENITQKLLDWGILNNGLYDFHDQSLINFCLNDRIKLLPDEWNYNFQIPRKEYFPKEKTSSHLFIFHMLGSYKGWQEINFLNRINRYDYQEFYYRYYYLLVQQVCLNKNIKSHVQNLKRRIKGHRLISNYPIFDKAYIQFKIVSYTFLGKKSRVRNWILVKNSLNHRREMLANLLVECNK